MKRKCNQVWTRGILFLLIWIFVGSVKTILAQSPESKFPGASHVPDSRPGWQKFLTTADPDAPKDEPQGGRTAHGSIVEKRIEECFPAEPRNLFWQVDRVASGPGGQLEPLNYDLDGDGKISDRERDAIRGQNTWMLWGEGNETFWGWLQERGYGLADFLILLDSRRRETRFKDYGLVNQPGMKAQADPTKRILGLYLDQADGENIKLRQPPEGEFDGDGKPLTRPPQPPPHHPNMLFKPGDQELYDQVIAQLPKDGVDYSIYGYPSGIVGLRLMPNPDFFGDSPQAERARKYWRERVEQAQGDPYYNLQSNGDNPQNDVNADPKLIRPFRPSMACAFCHVSFHPLAPPDDPENPKWENLSSTIGNQYWLPKKAFANLTVSSNFLHHFLASQQPGTIDTSLVSTDHINNPNTINAIFELPARLERAKLNPPELQSPANLLMRSVEDPLTNPRLTPRVLLDGADSIGVFGALSRVYLNIGTFSEEWSQCHNPIIGFKLQRPFTIATCDANSVFWRTAEKYRIGYLAAFFGLKGGHPRNPVSQTPAADAPKQIPVENEATAPMKLIFAGQEGRSIIEKKENKELASAGRNVFLRNCAICHSSKQPEDFRLTFSPKWGDESNAPNPDSKAMHLTLPMSFTDWELFKKTPAYQEYVQRIVALAGQPAENDDPFIRDNYLATDIRVPVTLVGTNSGRSVGTNGMRGQVWDNFSSEDYKALPAVGPVRFYNPYSGVQPDSLGLNDEYYPPAGGPGYYRPASLVSLWATAPYLHNNTLGLYNGDPSVKGRLAAFDDGISKLLWNSKRVPSANHVMGDLRWDKKELTKGDPGFIYRTTRETNIVIPAKFIEELLVGVIGPFWTSFLSFYIWIALFVILLVLTVWGQPRIAALVFMLLALVLGAGIVIARLDRVFGVLWLLPLILVGAALWICFSGAGPFTARISLGVLAVLSLLAGGLTSQFVGGALGPLQVGPVPEGTPVNLIMNINPQAPPEVLLDAGTAFLRGILMVKAGNLKGEPALHTFEKEAGLPLLKASKCPDFVLDRGHWFGESLSDDEKNQLIAFLRTL